MDPCIWNCHCQEVNYWLSNVWSENPFKTIMTALHCILLYLLSFGVEQLDRSVIHLFIISENALCCHLVMSYWTGQSYIYLLLQKNALISVHFQLLLLLCFWLHIVVVVHYTTTSRTTATTRMRMKRFM